jgi:hypothetical protein
MREENSNRGAVPPKSTMAIPVPLRLASTPIATPPNGCTGAMLCPQSPPVVFLPPPANNFSVHRRLEFFTTTTGSVQIGRALFNNIFS